MCFCFRGGRKTGVLVFRSAGPAWSECCLWARHSGRTRTPQRPCPFLLGLAGGDHPGDGAGAVPRSCPSPASASSLGHGWLWALCTSCLSECPPGVALHGLLTALVILRACRPCWLVLGWMLDVQTACGPGVLRCVVACTLLPSTQGRGHMQWLYMAAPGRAGHRVRAEHLVSLFRDHPIGPHRLEPATGSEGQGRGGVLGVLFCLAFSSHRALSRVRGLRAAGEATWSTSTWGGRFGVTRLHPKSGLRCR